MQNLKRNINIGFRVTAEEHEAIRIRMKHAGMNNMRLYLMTMAIRGQINTIDLADVTECTRLLRNVSNNINQISKRVHETGNVYAVDIDEIKTRQGEIWEQQDKIIRSISKLLEVA